MACPCWSTRRRRMTGTTSRPWRWCSVCPRSRGPEADLAANPNRCWGIVAMGFLGSSRRSWRCGSPACCLRAARSTAAAWANDATSSSRPWRHSASVAGSNCATNETECTFRLSMSWRPSSSASVASNDTPHGSETDSERRAAYAEILGELRAIDVLVPGDRRPLCLHGLARQSP